MLKKPFLTSMFLFRRDLRLNDNIGLLAALEQSEKVIPCFIFDSQQVDTKNDFRSLNAIQFMIESLQDLHEQLKKKGSKLCLFYGSSEKIIEKILKQKKIDALFCNRDYTPFSIKRDTAIAKICKKYECTFSQHNDLLLTQPEDVKTKKNTPFSIFTPFFKTAYKVAVDKPHMLKKNNFFSKNIPGTESTTIFKKILKTHNKNIHATGGTAQALKKIKSLKNHKQYAHDRDIPSLATTGLSAHLKFGTISIRHVFHEIKKQLGPYTPLLQQLYWRDFYSHTLFHYPHVLGSACKKKYNKLTWSNSTKNFDAWCTGRTGFPIVDAGMRQLNTTGFMHNRVRMIVASFLVKDLHIDWRKGEKYFAQQLVDYDPAVNNGNWQWVASTGCCAMPYFRIFNPWLQQKKHDPQCVYIKTWIKELKNIDPKIIHTLYMQKHIINDYPLPCVDHSQESKKTKILFKKI